MTGIRRVTSESVLEPGPEQFSNCLVVDNIAYLSGLTARSKDAQQILGTDEYYQSVVIFGKIEALLEAAGGAIADVVKLTIFVTNISNRHKVVQARRQFFRGDFPCSSMVEVASLASPEILVEIEAIAHLRSGAR